MVVPTGNAKGSVQAGQAPQAIGRVVSWAAEALAAEGLQGSPRHVRLMEPSFPPLSHAKAAAPLC